MTKQLAFDLAGKAPVHPAPPPVESWLAPPAASDKWDATGLEGEAESRGFDNAVLYVRHLRWKYDLD